MQKKKSLFPLVFAVLTAFALLIGTLDVFVYAKYIRGGRLYKLRHPVEKVDMTDPDGSTDYGRIYYSPVEEEHVVEYEDASGCGYIDNEVLVVANEGVTREQIAELAVKYDAEIVGEIEVTGDYQLRLMTAPDELDPVVESISAEPAVASAEMNLVMVISGDSTGDVGDYYYGKLWQKEITSSDYNRNTALSWGFREINTPMAWYALSTNERYVEPVNVGLLDCGFSDEHPDLGFKQFFYDNGNHGQTSKYIVLDPFLNMARDHGTNVSGILAANADDDTGICGVYPYGNGRLYGAYVDGAVKYDEESGDFWTSSMCEMVSFAELIIRNVKVINISMGFNYKRNKCKNLVGGYNTDKLKKYFSEESPDLALNSRNASVLGGFFERMLNKGYDFVICSSAGNDSLEETGHLEAKYNSLMCLIDKDQYPDVFDRIIVVGALGRDLEIADFSNAGDRTDIFAPGVEIYSTGNPDTYSNMSGTSQASPHVAGVAAMVWSACNSLTGAEVKQIIIDSAETSRTSVKMLNAFNAVIEAFNHVSFPITYQMAPTDSAVVGKVAQDSFLSKPIEGAVVTATSRILHNTYSTETDEEGQFELVLPMGTYDLTIEADGFKPYQSLSGFPISLGQNSIYRLKLIKLKKLKIKSSGGGKAETTTKSAKETPEIGKIYTNEDISKFLPEKFGKMEYGFALNKVRAWTYHDGNFYAVFDHAISGKAMSIITRENPKVHLVTITSEEEQKLVEELIFYGERDFYYTGGMVEPDGDVSTVIGEDTDYTNWYEGYPQNYGKEGYDDIIAVYRGSGDYPKSDPDYGIWFDFPENDISYLDFTDIDISDVTRGIVIEWEDAESEETTE